jgi:hypothetical protein
VNNPNFQNNHINPLGEMAELRLELFQDELHFDLKCRLRFSTMSYSYKDHEFEVGISNAHLRLMLEGCETTIDRVFGEQDLPPVTEEVSTESSKSASMSGGIATSSENPIAGNGAAKANVSLSSSRKLCQRTEHLPVVAGPNESWAIKPRSLTERERKVLNGTAIPGATLCRLRRKRGGNRMTISGEVHVASRAIEVKSVQGNILHRSLVEHRNKSGVVAQILKSAIKREASSRFNYSTDATVAVCRSEVQED